MKHLIDPTVDCVFKAILGALEHINLLCHFLNGILTPSSPITKVQILNPYNEKDFQSDKLSIVDIKARDEEDNTYQIEVQLTVPGYLRERIVYSWARLYQSQLTSGDNYDKLQPVISIWLLTENLDADLLFHRHFQICDQAHHQLLTDQCSIHVLELKKWHQPTDYSDQDYWLRFFKEAKHWTELPAEMNIDPMRQAMSVLEKFSEQEKDYHAYQDRLEYLRIQRTRESQLEQALEDKQQALEDKQQALEDKQQALEDKRQTEQENLRLRRLLQKAGVELESSGEDI